MDESSFPKELEFDCEKFEGQAYVKIGDVVKFLESGKDISGGAYSEVFDILINMMAKLKAQAEELL